MPTQCKTPSKAGARSKPQVEPRSEPDKAKAKPVGDDIGSANNNAAAKKLGSDLKTNPIFDAKKFLRSVSQGPGVYCMKNTTDEILYVGKAKNLRKRLASYFQRTPSSLKTQRLVRQIADVEVQLTNTETEALILEATLIKRYKPRYNVLLRDDKSYPYIWANTSHDYPRLNIHRGKLNSKDRYYGPYPSAWSAKQSLYHLQKLFRLRSCNDSFFAHRSRPCLQYQIKRCSGPCVDLISQDDYRQDVEHALMFLEGKNQKIIDVLVDRMEALSEQQDYEHAARYRDQIQQLVTVQEEQVMAGDRFSDCDVIGTAIKDRHLCVAMLFIRGGRDIGHRSYFPRLAAAKSDDNELKSALSAFVAQYYLSRPSPRSIIVDQALDDQELLENALSERYGHKVKFTHRPRGVRRKWLELAKTNATHSLSLRLSSDEYINKQMQALTELLDLEESPKRVECFDVSHSHGEATVASCVVFDGAGPVKSDYRRFNIRGVAGGDDYAALEQALNRRYSKVKKAQQPLPDLVIIDGGKGQLSSAIAVFEELQLDIPLLGVAKGPSRRSGVEQLFLPGQKQSLDVASDSLARRWIERIRDEAHRFAITGHRGRRSKKRNVSTLEAIPGLGPKRRKNLLNHFGGLQGVTRAGVDDLVKVEGISRRLAENIYGNFHHVEPLVEQSTKKKASS
ncbi:MAG: excinuclease ABC subunit UvrC [Gammaproteobacteria bacterium]|nr:excinuclease ABC subunit UvrC [Gammaproteobacteria bacterium]